MTRFERSAREATRVLDLLELPFALVGGFAVSVRCEPRFTRDVDLAVALPEGQDAESVVHAFVRAGHRPVLTVEHEDTDRLAIARIALSGGDILDLLFWSSGIEAEVVAGAERLAVLTDLELPVAQVGHLIALKLLSSDRRTRPQDGVDLVALAQVATATDLDVARRAIALIEDRGCHRGRDLEHDLRSLLYPGS